MIYSLCEIYASNLNKGHAGKNSMSEKDPTTSCIILMLKRFKREFIIRGHREGVLSGKGRDFVAASVPYDHVLPWKVGYNLLKA